MWATKTCGWWWFYYQKVKCTYFAECNKQRVQNCHWYCKLYTRRIEIDRDGGAFILCPVDIYSFNTKLSKIHATSQFHQQWKIMLAPAVANICTMALIIAQRHQQETEQRQGGVGKRNSTFGNTGKCWHKGTKIKNMNFLISTETNQVILCSGATFL